MIENYLALVATGEKWRESEKRKEPREISNRKAEAPHDLIVSPAHAAVKKPRWGPRAASSALSELASVPTASVFCLRCALVRWFKDILLVAPRPFSVIVAPSSFFNNPSE